VSPSKSAATSKVKAHHAEAVGQQERRRAAARGRFVTKATAALRHPVRAVVIAAASAIGGERGSSGAVGVASIHCRSLDGGPRPPHP
jgi:hypothetical protein